VHCIALRACDRRIDEASAWIVPERAAHPLTARYRGRYPAHEVTILTDTFRRLVKRVEFRWHEFEAREAAFKLGRGTEAVIRAVRRGVMQVERIKGLGGKRWRVPLVWARQAIDPCHGILGVTPDAEWGAEWASLASKVQDGFQQTLAREPVYRNNGRGKEVFRGWRWICPGCDQRVAIVYYPTRALTIGEYMGDEGEMMARAQESVRDLAFEGTDPRLPPQGGGDIVVAGEIVPAGATNHSWSGTLACHRCHRIRNWSPVQRNSWNHYIAHCTGGLMFGFEVSKPDWWSARRKRVFATHRVPVTVGLRVERLLADGLTYEQVAKKIGRKLATVQGHVKRIYPRWGVHKKRDFIQKYRALYPAPVVLRVAG